MAEPDEFAVPSRPADRARLEISKLKLEDGVTLDAVFRRVTELCAAVLQVERVGVWLLVEENRALRCIDLFEASKQAHSQGTTLQTAEFPEYFAALEARRTVPAEMAENDDRTRGMAEAYLHPLGISSMLDAPIYVGGEVIGALCHEHTGEPREWTTEQRDFASSMSDLLAVKIRAAETQDLRKMIRLQSKQLAEARRANDIAETAAGIAHDFKNILTVILGNAERIAADPSCPKPLAEYARQILGAGDKGVTLAATFMDYAHPGPSSSKVLRPAPVIGAQLPLLQAAVGERHSVDLDIAPCEGRILIDPAQLERLVLNLVVNARDAMPNGGTIIVRLQSAQSLDEDGKPGLYFRITVQDHGTGIAADVLPRIFDPYFTTKPRGQGTGVGLAVVQQIANYAGGFVRVDSVPGLGSSFHVFLPHISQS